MADGQRGQVAPVRKLVALVLGTFATFVILFGTGMTSWSIVALGVALLVLAISLVAFAAVRGGARAWVAGVGHVHSASEPPPSSTFGRCELQIVIDAPGLPPRSVKIRDPRVPVAKWPASGNTLPIMVAVDDQRHVRILWDEVPTHAEAAASGDLPPEFDAELGHTDDDLLIDQDAPPWAQRGDDDPLPDPDDGYPSGHPAPGGYDDRRPDPGGRYAEDPVVVRQTPGGTLVLEGTLVEPVTAAPLPRRAPSAGQRAGTATATMAPPAGDAAWVDPVDGPPGADPLPAEMTEAPIASAASAEGADGQGVVDFGQPVDEVEIDIDIDELAPPSSARAAASGPSTGAGPTAGPIHGVGVTLLVADLDRSVAFYRDTLGFAELDAGSGNAILVSGATRLVLRAIPDVAPINRRVVHLNLEVADLEAAYQRLRDEGVRFTYAPRAVNRAAKLELWAAAFRDPDGHGIALTQWRDRAVTD